MDTIDTNVSRRELATLQHDLEGPLNTFGGFLGELQCAVDALERLGNDTDATAVKTLIDADFVPCLLCLNDSLKRLRSTTARLTPDENA